MKYIFKNTLIVTLCLSFIATLYSCSSEKKSSESDATEEVSVEDVNEFIEKEFKYPIPTSFEVTQLLQDAGASFLSDITNSPDNVDKYETQRAKALNLGIYGADLSYASTFDKQEETMKYLEVSKGLVDGLQLSNVFTQEMADQIEANIESKDTLITIISKTFYETYSQLNKNGQDKLALLVVSGSWIEGLYITAKLAVVSEYDKRLMDIVGNQKLSAQKLKELCETYQDDEDVKSILPLIRFMNLIYDGVIEGAGITEGQLNDIIDNVEATRNDIIG